MAGKMKYELVSPERRLASGEAEMVTIPGASGFMGAGAGHTPVLTTLRAGVITIEEGSESKEYFVTGGFAEINGEQISILAEEAMPRKDLSHGDLQERIKAAREELEEIDTDNHHSHRAASERLNDLVVAAEHMF